MAKWLFQKSLVILISGKAGVGKTTAADELVKYFNEKGLGIFTIKDSFARGVKQVARENFGWDGKKDKAGRRLLQEVGRAGRKQDKSYWVKYMLKTQDAPIPWNVLFVDDWRFPDEAQYFFDNEIEVIRVKIESPERESLKGTEEYNDESETALDNYIEYEFIIENTESLEAYKLMVDTVAEILIQEEIGE